MCVYIYIYIIYKTNLSSEEFGRQWPKGFGVWGLAQYNHNTTIIIVIIDNDTDSNNIYIYIYIYVYINKHTY